MYHPTRSLEPSASVGILLSLLFIILCSALASNLLVRRNIHIGYFVLHLVLCFVLLFHSHQVVYQYGELITTLNDGAFLHPIGQSATISQLLIIHALLVNGDEHPCWESWHAANPGQWEYYSLVTLLSLLGASYPDFKDVVRQTAKRAAGQS